MFNFDPMSLFLSCLFSLIGTAFFIYGKKQSEFGFLGAGGLLMIYPYFVSGTWMMVILGVLLTAAPFVVRHYDLF